MVSGRDPRAIHRRLLGLAPGARRLLGGAVAAGAVGAVLLVVQAAALARIVDGAAFGGLDADALRGTFVVLAAALAGRALLSALTEWLGRRAAERAMRELRRRVAAHVLAARTRRVEEARRGELATAAVHGVDALAEYYAKAVPQIALAAFVPAGLTAVILWHDPVVGVLLGLTLPLVIVFMVLVGRASAERIGERRQALGVLGAHFLDVVRGLPTLRAHGRELAQAETLERIGERYRLESVAALRVAFLSALVLELLAMVGTAIVAAVVGVQLASGSLAFEAGLLVLLLAPEVYAPLRAAGQRYHAAEDGAHAAEALLAVVDAPAERGMRGRLVSDIDSDRPGIGCEPGAPPAPDPAQAPLALGGVRVAGGAGRPPALDGVDLEIAPGRITALVGASGAGKSTLLRLLVRLADPDEGSVTCGGTDLRDLPEADWWSRVAWLGQRPALLRGPLADTLLLARPDAPAGDLARALRWAAADGVVDELARDALGGRAAVSAAGEALRGRAAGDALGRRAAGEALGGHASGEALGGRAAGEALQGPAAGDALGALGDRAGSDAGGAPLAAALATPVGPGGRPLSGGQTQRLALAGALVSRAPLLLLDEPTAHLDPEAARRAADGIRAAAAGRTAVIATHDPALVAVCDEVVELQGGKVVGAGARLAVGTALGASGRDGGVGRHDAAAEDVTAGRHGAAAEDVTAGRHGAAGAGAQRTGAAR